MQEEYTSSQTDLENLLKMDPKNAPAKRELQLVKNYLAEVGQWFVFEWHMY